MSEEELGGALYTALLEKCVPCSVQDLCASMQGLSKRRSKAEQLLNNLCYTGLVTKLGDRYVVSEEASRYQEAADHGHAEAVGPSLTLETSRLRPNVNTHTGPDQALVTKVKDRPAPDRRQNLDLVPRQQHVVTRTSQQMVDCDPGSVRKCVADMGQILSVLQKSDKPLHGAKIAQLTGIGQSKKEVNRTLYFLADRGIIKKNDKTEWTCLVEHIPVRDLQTYGAELASKPERKQRQMRGPEACDPGTGTCECAKEGKTCYHFHQHVTNNQYNIQVGDNSTMYFSQDTKRNPDKDRHGGAL